MRTSETIAEISAALAEVQGKIQPPSMNSEAQVGQSRRYKYATLSSVISSSRDLLKANALAVVQEASEALEGVNVTTRILHSSGEWIEFGPVFMPSPPTAQGYGSAITYGRRYALSAALGIAADEDDDGQSAGAGGEKPSSQGSKTPAPVKRKTTKAKADSAPKSGDEKDSGADGADPESASSEPGDSPPPSGDNEEGPDDEISRLIHSLGWSGSKTLSFARNTLGLKNVRTSDWKKLSSEDASALTGGLANEIARIA